MILACTGTQSSFEGHADCRACQTEYECVIYYLDLTTHTCVPIRRHLYFDHIMYVLAHNASIQGCTFCQQVIVAEYVCRSSLNDQLPGLSNVYQWKKRKTVLLAGLQVQTDVARQTSLSLQHSTN